MRTTDPDDVELLRTEARRLVRTVLDPEVAEMERTHRITDKARQALKDAGYFGLTIDPEYGGSGIGLTAFCAVMEEAGWSHRAYTLALLCNNGLGARALFSDGSPEQKKKYLPKIASGEFTTAFGLTEPDSGSDSANMRTFARPERDGWLINGVKHYISNADQADVLILLAMTDREKKARGGITAFLIDKGTPGFAVTKIQDNMGENIIKQCEITFDNCWVPDSAVLGPVGQGFRIAMQSLDEGRLVAAASCVGHSQRCLELSVEHAKRRQTFGAALSTRQGIQWMLAEMATQIHAARSMTYQTLAAYERGERVSTEASMCKLFATEMMSRIADQAIQIHGGAGIMNESSVGRWWRDTRHYRIGEGTSEIQKIIIARALVG